MSRPVATAGLRQRIDTPHRSVVDLRTEGAEPRRIKSFYLGNDDLEARSARAQVLRKEVKPFASSCMTRPLTCLEQVPFCFE